MAKGNHEAYSSSAGKGTPYWYEWSVGLLRVVEMLYPESEISSVSFQEAGIKGWDDVVVRYTNGRTEYIQVKHSREGTNITFGSFVSADTDGVCLLESLFGAWRGMKLSSATAACVVFTNREAGERVYEGRPPLLDFMAWVKRELKTKKNLTELVPPNEWKNGWDEWRAKLCAGTNEEQSDFIRALSLNTSQPDLLELQTDIQRRLAGAFGTSVEKALPLLQAFNDALKDWTVRNFPVTAEDAFKALVLPGDLEVIEPAPPPPAPFFPTREKEAREIENALVREDAPPVFFLSAAPGAGKTSVLSRIELRRTERRLGGIVGLRYFAYRPITPESPLIPADADFRVRPESLWFSLLSQFRRELDGRLNHYRVPIRNNLLSWQEARAHVLRLADRIGTEIGRRFVMVIDGIDHAARAGRARYDAETARDFFASLPGPEELSAKCIRLMVAGQPAEFYPEYPTWLRASNPGVQRMELGPLQTDDIAALFGNASPKIPYAEWDTALDEIADTAKGNTLAIVFAVEEAKQCGSVIEFKARLQQRGLREGLQTYYESIWKYAFANVRGISDIVGTETALAGSLSLLKERVSGKLLATCFSGLGLSASQWLIVLANLGPVIVSEGTGFRVLHNDIRIFLANYLGTRPDAEKRWVYSALADYYLLPASDRRASHASLLSLLQNSERLAEWPRVFTVDWVFEAAAYAVPFDQILSECEVAMRASVDLRDWNVLHELTCASETIVRWQERTEANEPESEDSNDKMAPFFPPSELTVLPFNVWTISEIHQVTRDVEKIVSARELSRGAAILARWFDGLTVSTLGDRFFEEKDEEFRGHDSPAKIAADAFKTLGAVCREAGYYLERGENLNQRHNKAHFFFEQGWIGRSCSLGPFVSLKSCFRGRIPMYFNGCSLAICELAAAGEWKLVGRLLTLGHANRQKFSKDFRLLAPWFC
ncbi:MAG TPA: ATP-binding protein, partial [Verrucomicrobiae bacterium]|nr:ATP-binding protein [Verrucomicrobiae bacterium]